VAAACLPRGAPPAGRQVVADRQSKLTGLLPPTGDGVLRMLVTRPGSESGGADLYVVSVDSTGGQPVERLLVSNIDATSGLECNFGVAPCTSINAGGVWAYRAQGTPVLVDVVTGVVQELMSYPTQSQSGQWYYAPAAQGPPILFGPGGRKMAVPDAVTWRFIGDDFYYETPQGDLMDMPVSGTPQKVATGLIVCASPSPGLGTSQCLPFWGAVTPDGTVLFLEHKVSDPNHPWSIRDPLNGAETALPFNGSSVQLSPDGRWVLDLEEAAYGQIAFFDYRAGATTNVTVPMSFPPGLTGSPFTASTDWRPGTSEVWLESYDAAQTIWIVDPTKPATSVTGAVLDPEGTPFGQVSYFTPDGAYWFSTTGNFNTSTPVVQVGSADDPAGPRLALNTADQYLDPVWQFADGRLLLSVYVKMADYEERADAILFDPQTGAAGLVGERGRIATVGQTRMMGMFHFHEERGDLTVFDVGTGNATILAPEFATTAFAEQQGADQLAPGTRIAYQFQARTDSPYDGIWVAESP
jgi:hypothetical protein